MIKIAVCDDKNEAVALTEKINEIFEKDETMIRISYFKNAALLRYEVEDRVYFDLYILVIQQGRTEKEKQLMKTVRERDSEAFFLVLADKLEPTLAFPIKSVQIIAKNASDDEIEKAVQEAAQFEAEDKKRKEGIDARNEADSLVFQTQKALDEVGDKVDASEKEKVQADIDKLKELVEKSNPESMTDAEISDINAAKEALMQSAQNVFQKMYEGAQAAGGAAGPDMGAGAGPDMGANTSQDNADDVVDGDYREV